LSLHANVLSGLPHYSATNAIKIMVMSQQGWNILESSQVVLKSAVSSLSSLYISLWMVAVQSANHKVAYINNSFHSISNVLEMCLNVNTSCHMIVY
jgi:hypothetical protein